MFVSLVEDRNTYPGIAPSISLIHDVWDDYGLKTTFFATLWISDEVRIDLPNVKIMQLGLKKGSPPLPPIMPEGLPEGFASLGADFGYYEKVLSIDPVIGNAVFEALHDIAMDPVRFRIFSDDDTFRISLARLAPAKDALNRISRLREDLPPRDDDTSGPGIVPEEMAAIRIAAAKLREPQTSGDEEQQDEVARPLRLEFTPYLKAGREFAPRVLHVNFEGPTDLPSNLVAFVGPNGTGKTTLLSEIAMALFFGSEGGIEERRGTVDIVSGSVREVIFISYSAYDSFEIPHTQILNADARSELASQGYIYVGLRKLDRETTDPNDADRPYTLKSIREIDQEFALSLQRLQHEASLPAGMSFSNRIELFVEAIGALFEDPSIQAIATPPSDKRVDETIALMASLFPTLSTGHKAILNIIASLCVHLNSNSLVLMDEPEAHLHPPLVASLLRIVRMLLRSFDANAIVATHSPIVLQETLGQHVLRFRRIDNRTIWEIHPTQTFGENLAALTRDTFGLPAAMADFIGVLRDLIESGAGSLEEVEALFGERGLSSPGRAQVLRLIAAQRLGQVE